MQQLQQQQEAVEEVVAEEGAPLGNGLVVRRIEDPTEGSQGEKWGFSSCRGPPLPGTSNLPDPPCSRAFHGSLCPPERQ